MTHVNTITSTKDAYVEKMEAQVEQLEADWKRLRAKAKDQKAEAKLTHNDISKTIEQSLEKTKKQLTTIRDASEEAWKELQEGFENGLGELQTHIQSAQQKLQQAT